MIVANPYDAPIDLEDLKLIERKAYPAEFRELQDAETWQDVADYSEVPLRRLVVISDGSSWYAIIAKHRLGRAEFVDMAKIPGSVSVNWLYILKTLKKLGVRKLEFDARESTAYRRFMEQIEEFQAQGVQILKDEPFFDSRGETMHAVTIRL